MVFGLSGRSRTRYLFLGCVVNTYPVGMHFRSDIPLKLMSIPRSDIKFFASHYYLKFNNSGFDESAAKITSRCQGGGGCGFKVEFRTAPDQSESVDVWLLTPKSSNCAHRAPSEYAT